MILLKILPKYFKDVESGIKNFEIRKNDRKYAVGKYVCLREFDGEKFTGKFVIKQIQYIYEGSGVYGLAEGYCILGLDSSNPFSNEKMNKGAVQLNDTLDKIETELEQYLFENEFGSEYRKEVKQIIDKYKGSRTGQRWIPISERLPKPFSNVDCTCHSLIDDREDWVVETFYLPQLQNSPYSDWGNIPMFNHGECEVVAWMYREIPKPYKAESEGEEE